jgi:hypothetical protein
MMDVLKIVVIMTSVSRVFAASSEKCWTTGQYWRNLIGCTLMQSKPTEFETEIQGVKSQGLWVQCRADNTNTPELNDQEMCETWTDDGCMDAGSDWCISPGMKWDTGLNKNQVVICGETGPWKQQKCGCHVDYGGDRDTDFNQVEQTHRVFICNDRHESSNSDRNQKFYYMLNVGCDIDGGANCDATFVAKNEDIPRQNHLTRQVMESLCGHWNTYKPARYPVRLSPKIEADQNKVALALANGMFGEYDGENKNCNAFCLYDVDVATSNLAWIWDQSQNYWKRNLAPWLCWEWKTRNERNYAMAKSVKLRSARRLV